MRLESKLGMLCFALNVYPVVHAADLQVGEQALARGDCRTAIANINPLAHAGDVRAQLDNGRMAYLGSCGGKNYRDAEIWFSHAAKQGNTEAQYYLGRMYEDGHGGNDEDAVRWYRKAATDGYADAQVQLGWMYANGRGVVRASSKKAVIWFRKAADQGNSSGQYYLATMYEHGKGVSRDLSEAASWYRKAAMQDVAQAQNKMGVLYERGEGVPQDNSEAMTWYRKAYANGSYEAQVNLVRLGDEDARAHQYVQNKSRAQDAQAQITLQRLREQYRMSREMPLLTTRGTRVCHDQGSFTYVGFVDDANAGKIEVRVIGYGYPADMRSGDSRMVAQRQDPMWYWPSGWYVCQ